MIARNLPVPVPQIEVFRRWPIGGLPGGAIEAGLVGYYDATTEAFGDAVPAPIWHDRSGLGNDLTAVGTSKPTFRTAQLNDLQMYSFDGVDDSMSISNPVGWAGASGATIINVHNIVTPSAFGMICSARDAGHANYFEHREDVAGNVLQQIAGGGSAPAQGLTVVDAAGHITAGSYGTNDNRIRIFEMDALENTSIEGATPGISVNELSIGSRGAALFFSGMIGELWIYARRLTPAEITAKVAYLSAKWNIT